jgi:putative protease
MKKIELLAPAGSLESLYAAVSNGADAVYLGGDKFSARAYATNFNEEKLKEAVEYCHLYNVKIYVTVNTLIKDKEIEESLEFIHFLHSINVDAIIIQDTGLAFLSRNLFPDLEIHASTQMTIHNLEGARLLKEKGFSRVVLAREVSVEEIEEISTKSEVETEVFIHGALCISYSGQCLMSSLIGGRSGNRGTCAQPCRLPYELINKDKNISKKGYLLSPKDVCTLSNIDEIIKTGTVSLKIEGRMKRPEYVAGVVSAYRKAIDSYYDKKAFNLKEETERLNQLFNREGFSQAFLFGNKGKEMMALNYPKNTGVFIGKTNEDYTLTLTENLNRLDGVRTNKKGFIVEKIFKNGIEVEEAKKGDTVVIRPSNYSKNENIFKTFDTILMAELQQSFNDKFIRKIPVKLEVEFKVGEPIKVSCVYEGKTISVYGEKVQCPINKPLDKSRIEKSLSKAGNTPFVIEEIYFAQYEEGFLPVSLINELRRNLLDKLIDNTNNSETIYDIKEKLKQFKELDLEVKNSSLNNTTFITVINEEQLKAAENNGFDNIIVDYFMRDCDLNLTDLGDINFYLRVPSIVKQEFNHICKIIDNNLKHLKGIVTSNLGIIKKYGKEITILGDYKLNCFNGYSPAFYRDYLETSFISLELNKSEISEFTKKNPNTMGMIVYGKSEMMIKEYCPVGSLFGQKKDNYCTNACSEGKYVLKDRKDNEFPIVMDKFCRSHILNVSATNLIPNLEEIKRMNISILRLDFTDESFEETNKILQAYKEKSFQSEFGNYTRGHFKRGVE